MIDPHRDGPWQLGDWVWAGVCWAALLACLAALVWTWFDEGKPVH